MTTAFAGPGFLLQKGDGAVPENFTTVANVGDISGPDKKRDVHDITNQSSPGGVEEIIPGIGRTGDVAFPINWDPTNPTHSGGQGLNDDVDNSTLRNWRILLGTTGKRWSFSGYVVEFLPKMPWNGILRADIKIKPTGVAAIV